VEGLLGLALTLQLLNFSLLLLNLLLLRLNLGLSLLLLMLLILHRIADYKAAASAYRASYCRASARRPDRSSNYRARCGSQATADKCAFFPCAKRLSGTSSNNEDSDQREPNKSRYTTAHESLLCLTLLYHFESVA
jgi:hypothetical protein